MRALDLVVALHLALPGPALPATPGALSGWHDVFGSDDRRGVPAPASAIPPPGIGKIVCGGQWGTAFLVAPDVIATAVHNLGTAARPGWGLGQGKGDVRRCRFQILRDGRVVEQIAVQAVVSRAITGDSSAEPNADPSVDKAFLRLAHAPATNLTLLEPALADPAVAEIDLVAFHRDWQRGTRLARSSGQLLRPVSPPPLAARMAVAGHYAIAHPESLALSDVDAAAGSSGGPVMDRATGRVIGINHGVQIAARATAAFDPARHYDLVTLFDPQDLDLIRKLQAVPPES